MNIVDTDWKIINSLITSTPFEITFKANGVLLLNETVGHKKRHTWSVDNDLITFSLSDNFAVYKGKINGDKITGNAFNIKSLKWVFSAERVSSTINEEESLLEVEPDISFPTLGNPRTTKYSHLMEWRVPSTFIIDNSKSSLFSQNNYQHRYFSLTDYYPKNRYPIVPSAVQENRQFIYDFKDGWNNTYEIAAVRFGSAILNAISDKVLTTKYALCCVIPASTKIRTSNRFKRFCARISELLDCQNGYDIISVTQDIEAAHLGNRTRGDISNLTVNSQAIQGKTIYLFDDIITSGKSFVALSDKLRDEGAKEVIGFFLGKTYDAFRFGEPEWNK